MKIEYIFSRNEKNGSKLISWGSSLFPEQISNLDKHKIPSHVAILLDDIFIIESTLSTGVRVIPISEWLKHNELLYNIPFENEPIETVRDLLFEMYGKAYDWFGIIYFGYCMFKYYFFGSIMPKVNKYEREDYFFCTEFAGRLIGYNYSMTTPAKLCNDLLEKRK